VARIFISHSSRDQKQAEELKHWLTSIGFERAFLDFDKHTGIAPGADWERTLYREMERAQAVILTLTKNWFDSKWCFAEFTQARALGKPIFAVIETPTGETSVVSSDIQHLDLTTERDQGLARLAHQLTRVALDAQGGFDWKVGRAPYPGLWSFEAEDAAIFFGRDDDIRRAIERINARRVHGGAKLIAILAGSGAGKSSLLKAGVLPRLARDRANFLVTPPFRPGTDPLRGLLESLKTLDLTLTRADLENITTAPAALAMIDRLRYAAQTPRATLVLAIDQAEETFTRATTTTRESFLNLLSAFLAEDHPALAMLTLRADHLPDLQTAGCLTASFEEFSLKPMPIERLGLIVEGPSRVASLRIDERLAPALMRDAKTQDALPLVAFVLRRLYDRHGSGGLLDLAHYESLRDGGLSPLEAAIRDAAKEALDQVKPDKQELEALREAFVPSLVRANDEGGFVRQSAQFDRLPARAQRLLRRLVDTRLLVITTQEGTAQIEVAHEALFRVWPLLTGWLEEEREFLVGKSRIEKAREDYARVPEIDRAKGLLAGILLERAKNWLIAHPARFWPEEVTFIRASIEEADRLERERAAERERLREAEIARAKAEAERAEQEARRAQERAGAARRLQRWALAAAVLFAALGIAAGKLWVDADAAQREAEKDYRLALDQAASSVRDLAGSYAAGAVSTALMQSLLEHAQKTVQGLPGERPEVTSARAHLLDVLSLGELTLGRVAMARRFAEQQRDLADRLNAKQPGNREWRKLWSQSQGRLGQSLFWQGDLPSALAHLEAATSVAAELAAADPADEDLQENVLDYLARTGDALRAKGELRSALEKYQIWLNEAERLMSMRENKRWQASAADAHQRLGDGFLAMDKPGEAADEYRAYGSIAAQLADRDHADARWVWRLSWSHQRLGDALLAQGQLEQASDEYRSYLKLATELSNRDASNFLWHQDLEVAHQRIGEVLLKRNDYAGALSEFETYLDLASKTTGKDPSNGTALYDLSNAWQKVGDALHHKGDLDAALHAYGRSLKFAEDLYAKDASNASWQLILAVGHQRIGMTLEGKNDRTRAIDEYRKCLSTPINGSPFRPRILWPVDVHDHCRRQVDKYADNMVK
jgi:tetratricopeptide (TPR) repeat protein